MSEGNSFGPVDYVVVAGTILFSIVIGVYYAVVAKQTNEDLLMGGRQMGVWPIACSILVTYLSAISVLGYPAEIYANGTDCIAFSIVAALMVPLAFYLFVWVFHSMKLTSVYEYLELRFESAAVRWLASLTFILQACIVTGVVLYAPAIALNTVLGLPTWVTAAGIGVCGTIYTSIGGLKAVVWTDVFQFFLIFTGLVAMASRGFYNAGGISAALEKANQHGRIHFFNFTVDPFMRHNVWNFLFGYGFNMLGLYGTYQPYVQRYLSLPSFSLALRSILLSVGLNVITMTALFATGIAIFANYAGCDPVILGEIKKTDQISPYFVVNEMSFLPGMTGLFVSCIFSAVLSSFSSTLNSLAAVTWTDFLSRIPRFKNMSTTGQANISKVTSVFYGLITVFIAFFAKHLGSLLQASLIAVGATSGPLCAVFLMGLLMPCVNKWGALSGVLSSLISMLYVGVMAFKLDRKPSTLPTHINECPTGTNFTMAVINTPPPLDELDFPEKILTLSYLLYPFVGGLICILVGLIVSCLTGGCSSAKNVNREYLHPLLRRGSGSSVDLQLKDSQGIMFTRADRVVGIHDVHSISQREKLPLPPESPQPQYGFEPGPFRPSQRSIYV